MFYDDVKKETPMNEKIISRTAEIMADSDAACLALIDEEGCPTASMVSNIGTEGIERAWFSTGLRSNKVRRIKQDARASICYCDGTNNITLAGTVEVLTDLENKKKYWLDIFCPHFPEGPTDPNYCVLKFSTRRVSLWVDGIEAAFTL